VHSNVSDFNNHPTGKDRIRVEWCEGRITVSYNLFFTPVGICIKYPKNKRTDSIGLMPEPDFMQKDRLRNREQLEKIQKILLPRSDTRVFLPIVLVLRGMLPGGTRDGSHKPDEVNTGSRFPCCISKKSYYPAAIFSMITIQPDVP
jgi:hypothetical protein